MLPLSGGVAYLHKGEKLIDSGHLYFRDKLPPMDTTHAFHVDTNARCLLIRLLPLEMMPQLSTNLVIASDHYIFHLVKKSSSPWNSFYPQILSSMRARHSLCN